MTELIQGKVALVTGAGQGIGRCIAGELLKAGYVVVFADIDGEAAAESAAEYATTSSAIPYEIDVADEPALKALYAA